MAQSGKRPLVRASELRRGRGYARQFLGLCPYSGRIPALKAAVSGPLSIVKIRRCEPRCSLHLVVSRKFTWLGALNHPADSRRVIKFAGPRVAKSVRYPRNRRVRKRSSDREANRAVETALTP